MDKRRLNCVFLIVRRGYKSFLQEFFVVNFVLLAAVCISLLGLIGHMPPQKWQTTSFVLQTHEYQRARYGGGNLHLYTTDGREFVVNRDDERIRELLREGVAYNAVYSNWMVYDVIHALCDGETEFLRAEESQRLIYRDRRVFVSMLTLSFVLAILMHVVYFGSLVNREQKRMQEYIKNLKKRAQKE